MSATPILGQHHLQAMKLRGRRESFVGAALIALGLVLTILMAGSFRGLGSQAIVFAMGALVGGLLGTGAMILSASVLRVEKGGDDLMSKDPDVASELERTRGLYETLGQLSHRVRTSSSAQQLFSDACTFLVDVAGYHSAWIGTIDQDWTEVRPAAVVGAMALQGEAAFLPRRLADYQGLFSEGLARGEYQIIADLDQDDRTRSRDDRARIPLVHSMGVFPLRTGTAITGVLVVHAEIAFAMGRHETALIRQVAETVSLALDHLESRQRGKQVEQTQLEKQQLQEQLASVSATVPGVIGSWRLAPDGHVSMPFAGPALYDLYGLHPIEVRYDASTILKRVHPDDLPVVQQQILLSAKRMLPWQQDFRFEHPQKGWIWIEGHSMPQHEPDGSILWHGFLHDVTLRKQAEESLRESEERFRELFLKAPVAYQSLDAQGRYLDVNERLMELLGYPREELLGKPFGALWPVEQSEPFDSFWGDLLCRRQAGRELTLLRRDGTRVEVRFDGHVQLDASGDFVRTHCVLHDISVQRRAEQGLRLQSAALSAAANAIVITGPSGQIEWCNPAFMQMSGYSEEEAKGRTLGALVRSGMQSRVFYKQMWETISSGRPWHGELTNRRKDGSTYPERMSITPLLDTSRNITHYIAIKQDVSEHRRLEALLLRTQRLESIGRLASGVAHDLNNVLTPMLMAPLMLRSMLDDPMALQVVDSIESSARRGAAIIKQLLTFSRGLPGERIPVQLRMIALEMAKLIEQTFPKNITLMTRIDHDAWPILGDPTQIHQVLMNLTVNARDSMPKGGMLTIAIEKATIDEQVARAHGVRVGAYSVLKVEDTGIGIASEDLDRIYDPFFTTKPLGEGTGLGLSTALGIVKTHHGFITVDSILHKGTTFRVLFPAYESTHSPTQAGLSEDELPVGQGEKILVVDDEDLSRQMIHQVLEQYGYHVLLANGGADALETLKSHPDLSLILTDVMMPGMDGVTLVRQLRRSGSKAQVILMSGLHSQPEVIDLASRFGAQHLDKPFTAKSLLSAVRDVLHVIPDQSAVNLS